MKKLAVLVCGFVAACNYDTGECYLRDEGGAGVGGGPIVPGGTGGFGDVPPKPQDASDPLPPGCDTVPQSLCTDKCLVDYGTNISECDKLEDETAREACHNIAYARHNICHENCQHSENDCLDHCKDLCVSLWEGCYDKCGKDHVCKEKCMRDLIACNEKCEEKCK